MMLKRLPLSVLLAFVCSGAFAAGFSSLEERMNDSEFRASGLDQLTPEQLAQLNDWLRQNWPSGAATIAPSATAATPADNRGLRTPEAMGNETIVSRLAGEFTGWRKGSQFKLENGMVWEAVGSVARFDVRPIQQPTVTIEPAFFGSWMMKVEGYNTGLRVKRVE